MTKPNIHPTLHTGELLLNLPRAEYRPALVMVAEQLRSFSAHPRLARDEADAAETLLERVETRLA
ncbi:hypothetical protein [Phenylobacterium sp.]|uniref:hypothetical protein n=1 Tax=Phenylobacterium sp. TaxID=1871053 RepID=UPI0030F42365